MSWVDDMARQRKAIEAMGEVVPNLSNPFRKRRPKRYYGEREIKFFRRAARLGVRIEKVAERMNCHKRSIQRESRKHGIKWHG